MSSESTEITAEVVRDTATEVFGFESLRPGQLEVILDVMQCRPVVTVMPTGAGKSLCYQLPAVTLGKTGGVTLVVSPLIALMKDQVDSLRARDIEAAALTSAAGPAEQSEILDRIRGGGYTLVYVAPERFRSPRFLDALATVGDKLSLLAIDEAHCISEWGHDFRPDYRRLGEALGRLRPPRVIALTATATPEVREDIAAQLHLEAPRFHVRGFDRPNLYLVVEPAGGYDDKAHRLVEKVKGRTGGVALVYAATRKNAERYGAALAAAGLRVRVYHAGLEDQERIDAQDAFMSDRLDAIVATNAFGMGVDKADIRVVIHADLPRSPEAYYQEAGRGGRDGELTGCTLLFNHGDSRLHEFLIKASYPSAEVLRGLWKLLRSEPQLGGDLRRLRGRLPGDPHESVIKSAVRILSRHGFLREEPGFVVAVRPDDPERYPPLDVNGMARRAEIERRKLRTMVDYAYYPRCRRQFILEYFGDIDWTDRDRRCPGCDNCLGLGQGRAISDQEQAAAEGLLALIRQLNGRFGRSRIAKLANGSDDDERFLELPERGLLRGHSDRQIFDLIRALQGGGLVEVSRGEYPTLSLTAQGRKAAAGELELGQLGLNMLQQRKTRRVRKKMRSPEPTASWSDDPVDAALVERLRSLRRDLAEENAVPAYVIFSNKTLEAIARARPTSEEELSEVRGIGPSRLSAYGEKIIAAVRTD